MVVGASVGLTCFHFTDNFVAIDTYPPSDWVSRPVIVLFWPLLSAIGVTAFFQYRDGNVGLANLLLAAYGLVALSSLGHFLSGGPEELTTRGLTSVLLDGAVGTVVLGVAVWSILGHRSG